MSAKCESALVRLCHNTLTHSAHTTHTAQPVYLYPWVDIPAFCLLVTAPSAHHTTPHHTLSTPQLYSPARCRVRSPGRQGPGTASRQCTNSVGCVHVPVPSTIPRDPAAPSTGRLGPGNGQRPLPSTAGQASPSSPPNTPAHTRGPQQSPAMRPPQRPCLCPPRRRSRSQPPPLPRNLLLSLPFPPPSQAGSAQAARLQCPASAAGRVGTGLRRRGGTGTGVKGVCVGKARCQGSALQEWRIGRRI